MSGDKSLTYLVHLCTCTLVHIENNGSVNTRAVNYHPSLCEVAKRDPRMRVSMKSLDPG